MFQEHIQNYVKLSKHLLDFFISAAGGNMLELNVQTIDAGPTVGPRGDYQESPVHTVNQQVPAPQVCISELWFLCTGRVKCNVNEPSA